MYKFGMSTMVKRFLLEEGCKGGGYEEEANVSPKLLPDQSFDFFLRHFKWYKILLDKVSQV
jgi:hypothetical protein